MLATEGRGAGEGLAGLEGGGGGGEERPGGASEGGRGRHLVLCFFWRARVEANWTMELLSEASREQWGDLQERKEGITVGGENCLKVEVRSAGKITKRVYHQIRRGPMPPTKSWGTPGDKIPGRWDLGTCLGT